MQAPTTPNAAPAGEPGLRVCPACRAINGQTNDFCWQCYRPFLGSNTVPQPPAARGLRGVVLEAPTPAPVPEPSRWNLRAVLGVILTTALLVAGVVVFLNRSRAVELPERFGGLARMSGPEVDLVIDLFHAEVENTGVQGDIALYSSGGVPTAAVVWMKDASVTTAEAAFDAFALGFNEGLPAGALDETRKTTELVGAVTYVCAPVEATPPSTICLWEDAGVFWILVDLSGASQAGAQDLAVTAHDAIAA
ncbi:MAG: hypothetical protein ACRDGW_02960 [Actinomycetota bacterium]